MKRSVYGEKRRVYTRMRPAGCVKRLLKENDCKPVSRRSGRAIRTSAVGRWGINKKEKGTTRAAIESASGHLIMRAVARAVLVVWTALLDPEVPRVGLWAGGELDARWMQAAAQCSVRRAASEGGEGTGRGGVSEGSDHQSGEATPLRFQPRCYSYCLLYVGKPLPTYVVVDGARCAKRARSAGQLSAKAEWKGWATLVVHSTEQY